MLPATPAIHYTVSVACYADPCPLPIQARMFGGGGSPTPVSPQFTTIVLRIDPMPTVMPTVTWRSQNPAIAYPSFESPLERTMHLPGDTSATPPPNYLRTLLIPAGSGPHRIGDVEGETLIEADIGAPVNERVIIPVYTSGSDAEVAPPAGAPKHLVLKQLAAAQPSPKLHVRIAYADPVTSTYGDASSLFTEVPWQAGTGGFWQGFNSLRVEVSPQPISVPSVAWSIAGDSATLTPQGSLRGVYPGKATVSAQVGAPFNETLSLPLITYATLVLPCHNGVRFTADGTALLTTDENTSDLYSNCASIRFPGGGVLLTNGNDPDRPAAKGAIRGPQFPDLTASLWRNELTELDATIYDASIEPCNVPESATVSRIDYACKAMPARTLLFRTRDGRSVKWLIQIGNGFSVLAGPYQVL